LPTWALYLIGVLVFAFGLLGSIALHEVGHMVPAKKFGVKVTQYMVGFGPTLWSRKKGDTEYGLKAIPVGGYIRMIGMVPPRRDGKVSRWPRRLATAVEEFRQVSRAEVEPQDEDRQFYRLTPGKKMIVMLGGPCMNLVIFLVLFVVLIMTLGVPARDQSTTTVGSVLKCVVPANSRDAQTGTCPKNAAPTPASQALKPGDKFVSIDGTKITGWDQLSGLIRPAAGKKLSVVVLRNGKNVALHITPVPNKNYVNAAGTKLETVGFIGFEPRSITKYAAVPVTGVPGRIGSEIKLGVDALGKYPQKIHSLWQTVFEGRKRDPQGAVGVVGIGRISGDYASSNVYTTRDKAFILVNLLAGVNLLLFFFNLLPLLPLDGGHVAGALVESVKRGRARLRARKQPVPIGPDGLPAKPPPRQIFVDTASMLPVMYGVASVLILLTLLTLYADIVKPINPVGG
jgi:membrane-associated protease RseP (regulator of RpoE activity)